jgi:N-acetylglucosamine kinase-like BadF-type ATPase
VISGTGMIAYGRNEANGREATAGGHGVLIDDGSGYMIGLNVARAVLHAHDFLAPQTTLSASTLSLLNFKHALDLVPFLYDRNTAWGTIASLAPIAFKCADEGDEVAQKLLQPHADFLAAALANVANKLGFQNTDSIPLYPSVSLSFTFFHSILHLLHFLDSVLLSSSFRLSSTNSSFILSPPVTNMIFHFLIFHFFCVFSGQCIRWWYHRK